MAGRLDERRSDWVGIQMIKYMFLVGSCFKRDLTNLARMTASAPKVSRAYNELEKMGVIKITSRLGRECVDVTEKAKTQMSDLDEWYRQNDFLFNNVTRKRSENAFQKLYGRSKALMSAAAAGAATLPFEKPEFYEFWKIMSGEGPEEYELDESDFVSDDIVLDEELDEEELEEFDGDAPAYLDMSKEEIKELLETYGIFYSINEIADALKRIYPGNPDQWKGTRCRGVLFTQTETYAIYCGTAGMDRMAKWHQTFENQFKNIISDIAGKCTGTFRKLDIPGANSYNSVKAVFIAEGNVRISEMLTLGMKNQKSIAQKKMLVTGGPSGLVNWEQEVYDRMFVVSSTVSGMEQFKWLIEHDFETWIEEGDKIFGTMDGVIRNRITPDYAKIANGNGWAIRWALKENNIPCLYMPVAEIKLLHGISIERQIDVFSVVCPEDLINPIREGTRKKVIPVTEKGKVINKEERKPKLSADEKKKFRRMRMHRTSLELTTQEANALKAAATEAGMSVNKFVRKWASGLASEMERGI